MTPRSSFAFTDAQRHPMVDNLNQSMITAPALGRPLRSLWPSDIHRHQAYSDVAPFASDAGVSYASFLRQPASDFQNIRKRLHKPLAHSPEFDARGAGTAQDLELLVLPSGTSRQCIPAHWAAQYLRQASHAFLLKDPLKKEYEKLGLRCVDFYAKRADMVALARQANWSISTDTFSLLVLEYLTDRSTVLLTELSCARVVSPFYRARIVQLQVPCYLCKKVVRAPGSTCQAGYAACLNGTYPEYAADSLQSVAAKGCR